MLNGRRSSCHIHLLEASVSTAHAVLFDMNGERHIRDLGSRTGTFINGVQVHQHQLNDGDKIRIGETTLTYAPGEAFGAVDTGVDLGATGAGAGSMAGASAAGGSMVPIAADDI